MCYEYTTSSACFDALGKESILVYIKCIRHVRDLMIKAGKLEDFNKVLLEYTPKNGMNICLTIMRLADDFGNPFLEEICNFLCELNFPLNYSNWEFTTLDPRSLKRVVV
jgi:hypothetical protein